MRQRRLTMIKFWQVPLVIFSLVYGAHAFAQTAPDKCLNCLSISPLQYDKWKAFWGSQICNVVPTLADRGPDELKKIARAEIYPFKKNSKKSSAGIGGGFFGGLGSPVGMPYFGAAGTAMPSFNSAGQAVTVSILAGDTGAAKKLLKQASKSCKLPLPSNASAVAILDPTCALYEFSVSSEDLAPNSVRV